MKKTLLIAITLLWISFGSAQTQTTSSSATYRNLFKVSASQFTRNTFQMGFEHFFTPTSSMLLNAGMNFRDSDMEQFWGVNAEAQVKLYVFTQIKPRNSHRLYFAPYLMYNYEEVSENQWNGNNQTEWVDDTFDAVGTGVLFGWSFSFANRINLDIYTGGGIRKSFNVDKVTNNYNGVLDYSYSGITPRLGIDIGFWF